MPTVPIRPVPDKVQTTLIMGDVRQTRVRTTPATQSVTLIFPSE